MCSSNQALPNDNRVENLGGGSAYKKRALIELSFDTNIIAEIIWTIWTTLFFCLFYSILHGFFKDFRLRNT